MSVFTCPNCHAPLVATEKAYRCAAGHSHDRAREGHVNLLGSRKAPEASYPREMNVARREFLAAGHYQPVVQHLVSLLGDVGLTTTVLDAGCGTGFYLGQVGQVLTRRNSVTTLLGVDISKDCAKVAARDVPGAHVAVCDVLRHIEVPNASVDVVLSIFFPRNGAEFARVLRPGGRVVVLMAGPQHLHELRKELNLLDIESEKEERALRQLGQHLTVTARDGVRFTLDLPAADVVRLLTMSPNYFHREQQGWATNSPGPRTVTIEVRSLVALRAP